LRRCLRLQTNRPEKKAALNTWDQDERLLLTASNEGMAGSEEGQHSGKNNRLDDVVKAKQDTGAKPSTNPFIELRFAAIR
jgi:hypothetical protein